jgi:DeoR family transcriptional regulator, catabolite repression regulator
MAAYKPLASLPLVEVKKLHLNELAEPLTQDSPASFVMTDFTRRSPRLIDSGTSVDQAIEIMQKVHVKSKLVVNENLTLIGIVNLSDLLSRKVLMVASQKGVRRQDITVDDIMVKVDELHAVRYQKVLTSKIGDLLVTMQALGELHLLVIDNDKQIRGVISAVDIGRALHIPHNVNVTAHSFRDVFNVLHEHSELN